MHPTNPVPPKPGTLTAVQVILFIVAGLAALGFLMAFSVMGQLSESQLQRATGMSSGAFMFSIILGAVVTAFYAYVAFTMGRGGFRTRTLVRAVVGVGAASALLNMMTGQNFVIGLVLMIVVLGLNESASAKQWYAATENPQQYQGH